MATGLLTSTWTTENFYETTLSADITNSALDVFLTTVPTNSEGTLVIDPDSSANREIVYYSSKTGTKVICPANGRGYDNSTAVSHTSGTKVIMAPIADWFTSLKTLFTTTPGGYTSVGYTPNTVTYNGNRSYDCVYNSVDLTSILSAGMRLKHTRTVTAPTQCTDLESGSSQYYSKTTPNKLTFTDDFVVSAWIKQESYAAMNVASRSDGSSGWLLQIQADGTILLQGTNGGGGNFSRVVSYQSVPLGKWVHIAAQLDMSTFTATTTTSYIMIDGVDVPASVARAGTNPTALVQAGNLNIGAANAGVFYDGKLAQVAIYNAKVTQATIKASMSQTLSGSETSLASAYSFNNSITDLNTTTPNDLTAQGSAVATNADSPFGQQADGTTAGTTEYAIITKTAFSTNTTLTVQVPEGNAIPTSGGVSAVSYSTQKVPYGFPADSGRWTITALFKASISQSSPTTFTYYFGDKHILNVPIGSFNLELNGCHNTTRAAGGELGGSAALSTSTSAVTDFDLSAFVYDNAANINIHRPFFVRKVVSQTAATNWYAIAFAQGATTLTLTLSAGFQPLLIHATPSHL